MSKYRGWDEAGMRNVPLEMTQKKRRLNTEEALVCPPMLTAFTPFNQSSTTTVPVQKPLRARKSESSSIYDLPEDPVANVQPLEIYTKNAPKTPPLTKHGSGSPWTQSAVTNGALQLTTPPDSTLRPAHKLRKQGNSNAASDGVVEKHTWTPTEWTTTKSILNAADFHCGQTTLDKLAAFRFKDPKKHSAGPIPWVGGDEIKASGVAAFNRDPPTGHHPPAGGCTPISEYHGETDQPFIEAEAILSDGDGPPIEAEATLSYGEEPSVDELMNLDNIDWQEILHLDDAGGGDLGMEEITNLNSTPWQDISLLQDESDDEFPMPDNEVAEMARLQVLDTHNGAINSPTDTQVQGEQDFQDHGASHDQQLLPSSSPSSSPSNSSSRIFAVNTVLSNSLVDRGLVTVQPTLSSSLSVGPSPIHEGEERNNVEKVQTNEGHHELAQPEIQVRCPRVDDSADYLPLARFARPPFPSKVCDRSPILGVSAATTLRTCFRIGEVYCKGALCGGLGQEVVIELFARVKLSSMDPQTLTSHFEFSDLFHDGPPFLQGQLEKVKPDSLQETESRQLLGEAALGQMIRCLGVLTRIDESSVGMLRIINIRATDWEEIRWTKAILDGGAVEQNDGASSHAF